MKCERAPAEVRDLCEWLFESIENLGGADGKKPAYQDGSGWYRSPPTGKVCLYVYVVGPKGKRHPNTVHLTTLWTEEFKQLSWVEQGNYYFGSVSADFFAKPGDPEVKERALDFVRRAYRVVAVNELAVHKVIHDPSSTSKDIEKVINDGPEAKAAAGRLKTVLTQAGDVTLRIMRDILVNVVSEAAKQVMFGK